ncbi:hypothetical protein WJX72_010775 [[Myrmecia] bisecta]|uniref:Uncharacterized protein n=1 Tax=[Myrmecia] bisecta TaxID=41462 RepID=A0AAW1PPU3_9CHLO
MGTVPTATTEGDSKFARALGSVSWRTREQALSGLIAWLQKRKTVTDLDMMKIWKGLFYCFWHSDKQHIQAELANRLSGILLELKPVVALMYFEMFLKTMQREWFGIDRLRLDKFMTLVRRFIHAMFALLRDSDWDAELAEHYIEFVRDEILVPSGSRTRTPAGLVYHLADVWIPELQAAAVSKRPSPATLHVLVMPFCRLLAALDRPMALARVRESVFDAIVEDMESPSTRKTLRDLDMRKLAAQLFDQGAAEGVKARSRDVLYDLSKLFETVEYLPRKRARRMLAAQARSPDPESEEDVAAVKPPPKLLGSTISDAGSSARKSVQFSLKKNLYHKVGEPVPPPAVRTPPAAKPKGSALKVQDNASTPAGARVSSLKPRALALQSRSPKKVARGAAAAFF